MKKPKTGKPGKKAKPWAPTPVAVQRKAHRIAVRTWKPTPVAVQVKRHKATVKTARTKAARAKHPVKPRRWSPGLDVACCSAQAVGTLLGLSDAEVLELYWLTADDPDEGATIEATLAAAVRPVACRGQALDDPGRDVIADLVRREVAIVDEGLAGEPDALDGVISLAAGSLVLRGARPLAEHGLILGVTMPEPHAVAVTPDGTWHSWGEPFNPAEWPDLIIDEAWAVLL